MKLTKRLCAAAAAVTVCVSAGGCSLSGGSSSSSEAETTSAPLQTTLTETTPPPAETEAPPPETEAVTSTTEEDSVPDEEEIRRQMLAEISSKLPDEPLDNKIVRRFAETDLDPASSDRTSAALQLFSDKYGGEVEWVKAAHDERFEKLAAYVLSADSPDIFPTDSMDTFPRGAVNELFMPLNTVLSSEGLSHPYFDFNGSCYAAFVETVPEYFLAYSLPALSAWSLPAPAELYAQGNWNRPMFEVMNDSFGGKAAVGGKDIARAFSMAGGVPLLTMENGKIVTNISDGTLAETQDWIYSLGQEGKVKYGSELSDDNSVLFEVVSVRDFFSGQKTLPDRSRIIPVPSGEGEQYMPAYLRGYHFCKGAGNPEGAVRFIECEKLAAEYFNGEFEKRLTDISEGMFADNIDAVRVLYSLAKEYPVVSCTYGMPLSEFGAMAEKALSSVLPETGSAVSWQTAASEIRTQLEYAVRTANDPEPLGP